jgi:hypothetical protein
VILADVALAELRTVMQRRFRLDNVEGSDPVTAGVELADGVGSDQAG